MTSTIARIVAAAGAVVGVASLAGCSSDPIQVGAAPPPSGQKITLAPAGSNGLTPATEWPKACDLIPESDIKAILPQADKIDRQPQDFKYKVGYGTTGGDQVAPGALCRIEFALPHVDGTNNLLVSIEAVGDPEIVQKNLTDTGNTPSNVQFDALGCNTSPEEYNCRKQNIAVGISWTGDPSVEQYQGQPKAGKDEGMQYWHDHVAPEFVKAVLNKLP